MEKKFSDTKSSTTGHIMISSTIDNPNVKMIIKGVATLIHSNALYDIAQFSGECCIICLIYINRVIALTGMPLLPTSWRPLVLISLMVAQKMWDDRYLSNSDFSAIYPFFDNKQLNTLEMKFLELIQYNTHIRFSIYTKYYLELKSLVPDFPLKPMDVFTMGKLEKQSKNMEDNLKKNAKTSNDNKEAGQNTVYVIN